MKKNFLIIFLFLLGGCKFSSFYEANISCNEWKEEGGTYMGVIEALKKNDKNKDQPEYLFEDTVNNFSMRGCQFDKETNQIIGLDLLNREQNKKYYLSQDRRIQGSPLNMLDTDLEWQISKRFRY